MIYDLANAGLLGGFLLLLALPALFRRGKRSWVLVIAAVAVADLVLQVLPIDIPAFQFVASDGMWNWSGKLLGLAGMLAVAAVLIATGRFTARDMGLTFRQEPGSTRPAFRASVVFLLLAAVLVATSFGNTAPTSDDALMFQATMPGLAEVAYRGLLLAMFDRIFTARFRLGGAAMGYGAIATALAYGFGNGAMLDVNLDLQVSTAPFIVNAVIGFFLAWLRTRTKSLVLPVIVHNAVSVMFTAVPLMA